MKEKILLDTNILIYLLDDNILDSKVAKITKTLYDSDKYSIVIHPRTLDEADKIKDEARKAIFKSKLSLYNVIDKPPNMSNEFNTLAGAKNINDKIDNEMLYALKSNCVSYFITNDKKLNKKGIKLGLGDRVLSLDDALEKFREEEKIVIDTPVFITKEYLYNIQLNDVFFDTLKSDYLDFEDWFIDKQRKGMQAYITRNEKKHITSFLMIKEENQNEDYSGFEDPFKPARRLKISTFKVNDTGKRIGECFIKIIVKEAIEKQVDEIYITTFSKQQSLIFLLKEYGFKFYTFKNTVTGSGKVKKESIFVKDMKNREGYPFVSLKNQEIFIIPVQPHYHKLLFEEAEKEFQISIEDMQGMHTSANAIRKAFISNSKRRDIKPKDIVLFYASQDKKAITTLGIVEATWNKFDSKEEIYNIVRKRTAYTEDELQEVVNLDSLVIMFKHYITFNKYINYDFLLNNGIVNGYIQAPIKISKDGLKKIIEESGDLNMFKVV